MNCHVVDLPDGTRITICGANRTRKTPSCHFCGKPSSKLCDFPVRESVGAGKSGAIRLYDNRRHTCDAPMCEACAVNAGLDSDLCPPHANQFFGAKTKAAKA